MTRRGLLAAAAAAVLLPLAVGCSKNNDNTPPVIDFVTASPETIQVTGSSHLIAEAHDDDNDPLRFEWQASLGTIESSGRTATWHAPDLEGTYSILCTVDDGHGGQDHAVSDIVVLSRLLAAYGSIRSFQAVPVTYGLWQSQGFVLPRDALIDSIGVKIDHLEGDPGSIIIELWGDGPEGPTQRFFATPPRLVPAGWHMGFVPDGHFVQKGVHVSLVVRTNQTGPGGSYVLAGDGDGRYADGANHSSEDQGATWTVKPLVDLEFRVVGRWQ